MTSQKVIGVTNALMDILINISEEDFKKIGLKRGGHTPLRKIDTSYLQKILEKKDYKKFLGGGPTNTIRGLNNLGIKCSLIGAIGEDETGEDFVSQLYKEGINPYFLKIPEKESGKCYVFITPDGERSFVVNEGVYDCYPEVNFEQLPKQDLFFSSGYEMISNPKRMLSFAKSLKKLGTKIGFDLASESMVSRFPDKFAEMISYSDIVFGSKEEIKAFNGLEKEINNQAIFILKKGKEGSIIYHKDKEIKILPTKVEKLINTNGAGDSYATGFLFTYLKGKSLEDCGNFASRIASKVCSQEESWYQKESNVILK
jgi:sugar/nucleoside kinase (ribokinase family)